ncbi:MAG TPA: zf-HC2 domain-containing protein [Acidimicrobiia bacterium]|nr:zf-HC2 domain-containing protein [Acidimicrobiia bacterium]
MSESPTDRSPSCSEALEQLHAVLDGELPSEEARRIIDHLEACPPCELEGDSFRRIKEAVAASGNALDPASLARVRELTDRLCREGVPPTA